MWNDVLSVKLYGDYNSLTKNKTSDLPYFLTLQQSAGVKDQNSVLSFFPFC